MNNKTLFKIAITTSFIGIILLLFLSQKIDASIKTLPDSEQSLKKQLTDLKVEVDKWNTGIRYHLNRELAIPLFQCF